MTTDELGKFLFDFHEMMVAEIIDTLGPVMGGNPLMAMLLALVTSKVVLWQTEKLSQYFELQKNDVCKVLKDLVEAKKGAKDGDNPAS